MGVSETCGVLFFASSTKTCLNFFSFLKSSGMRWVCKTEQCMSSYTPLFHNFFVVGLLQMSDEHKGFGLGSE